jgi:hypothetical protein
VLNLPTTHHVPATWLLAHAGPTIRYRLATEVLPGLLSEAELADLGAAVEQAPAVKAVVRKQKDTGLWGGNLLGVTANKTAGIKDVGTIPQFRRLLELAVPLDNRALRLAGRTLFRLVSRDEDPKLLFEYAKLDAAETGAEPWIRIVLREAAAAALAQAGYGDDPRVRGAAHKILNEISAFLRSELPENPFLKSGGSWVLNPAAYAPTVFSVSLFAWLPAVQRERAGLVEKLGQFLATPAPKKTFSVTVGKKSFKPNFLVLGEPFVVSAGGQTADLPYALFWLELLARLGSLQTSASAGRLWARLLKDCKGGIWHPRNLRTLPKGTTPWSYHMFPLDADAKGPEAKQTDVTFRMAYIARLAGLELTHS